jgi:hypothetical protein
MILNIGLLKENYMISLILYQNIQEEIIGYSIHKAKILLNIILLII